MAVFVINNSTSAVFFPGKGTRVLCVTSTLILVAGLVMVALRPHVFVGPTVSLQAMLRSQQLQTTGCNTTAKGASWMWKSTPHVSVTSYTADLTEQQLQKGIVSYGSKARARRSLAKLLVGKPISIAFIGGSVTWGHGASKRGETDYASIVVDWIRRTFPAAQHTLVNGAKPGTPSSYFALCHQWHVPDNADIVVVEFNINDGPGKIGSPIRRAHERLLRKLLSYNNRPAVLEMVFFRYPGKLGVWWDSGSWPAVYRYHGDDDIGVFAQYYHLPWLATRSLVWDYLKETAQDNTTRTDRFLQMWSDADHPSDKGHRWMADMIIYWMEQTLDDLVRQPVSSKDEEEAQAELSLPMYRGNFESKNNTCLMGDQMRALVTSLDPAFKWVNEGTVEKPKWGYISTEPGSSLNIVLQTSVTANLGLADNVSLAIGHLKV